jgi:hypothetical protein
MKWTIAYSREADRFIQTEDVQGEVKKQIEGFLRKLRGESLNIDGTNSRENERVILESGRVD